MKIRLLIVPGLIAASIVVLIWFAYPAYSNPTAEGGLAEKLEKLKMEEEKLKTIEEKKKNSESLFSGISQSPDKKKTLFEFIPESIEEENIIDSLNYLISSEGISVLGISVSPPKETPADKEEPIETSSTKWNEATKGGSSPAAVPVAKSIIKDFEAKAMVVGDYQKIKNIADKINRMVRFNNPALVEIKPAVLEGASGEGGSQKTDPNVLQAEMTFSFSLLKKSSLPANPDNPIFLTDKFDMTPVDKIKEKRNIEKINLEIGQIGKPSPFLP